MTATGREPARERLVVLALVLLAFAVRAAYVSTLGPAIVWHDGQEYSRLAESLVRHGVYERVPGRPSAFWPPGYPFLLAAIYAVAGVNVLAVRLVQAVLGAFTTLAAHRIARRAGGVTVAHAAGAVCALYPLHVYAAGTLYPIVLQAALVAGVVWLALRAREGGGAGAASGAGALAGWAALTAGTAAPALLLVAPWLVLARTAGAGRALRQALAYVAVMAAVIAPWTARNLRAFGEPVVISCNAGYNLWLGNYPGVTAATGSRYAQPGMDAEADRIWSGPGNEATRDLAFRRLAMGYIRADVPRFLELTARKALEFWAVWEEPQTRERPRLGAEQLASWLSYGLLLPFAALALVLALRREPLAPLVLLMLLAATAVHAVVLAKVRYRLPFDTFLVVYGVVGLQLALRVLRRPAGARPS